MDTLSPTKTKVGHKRIREFEDDNALVAQSQPQRKHIRPAAPLSTLDDNQISITYDKFDSSLSRSGYRCDRASRSPRMIEEDKSQDSGMSSSDDGDADDEAMEDMFTHSPLGSLDAHRGGSAWRDRMSRRESNLTPLSVKLMRASPNANRSGHVRQRHPQEYACEYRDGPSPMDQDEAVTPRSANMADATGSQLSMLSMSDMEVDVLDAEALEIDGSLNNQRRSSKPHVSGTDHRNFGLVTASGSPYKTRQRSGAQSNGSASPATPLPTLAGHVAAGNRHRSFTVGYRADCDKCRMRVAGHMNHFV